MDTLRLTPWPLRRLGIVMELGPADVREYVMTYAAYGPAGPRIAAAVSRDLVQWQRRGLVRFGIAILIVVLGCLFTRPAKNALRWGASARLASRTGSSAAEQACAHGPRYGEARPWSRRSS